MKVQDEYCGGCDWHDGGVMSERLASGPGLDPDLTIDFPRPLKGPSTQHQLLTLLVDYWFKSEEWLPSRLIAALAAGLGITPSASASALSRLASRGVLEQSSIGRTSRYRVTQGARNRLRHGFQQVSAFGEQSRQWDGNWTVIAFSIPETSRDVRELLRSRLRWRGFAPLFGALWVSPRDHSEELENACKGYGVEDYVIFRTAESTLRGKRLIEAWSPQEFREQYRPFTEKFAPWAERVDAGRVSPAEAFRVRTELMDAWRAFPWSDPDLPAELLPEAWPRAEARDLLVRLYDGLADTALAYIEEVVARESPELAGTARALSVSSEL
jgi:phenylacetic acid degradation operon negative regulatory protein